MSTRQALLEHLWREVIDAWMRPKALAAVIDACKRRPNDPFSEVGAAIERLLASGANPDDIRLIQRAAACEATFGTLYAIGDPGVDGGDVYMLHEELLTSRPEQQDWSPRITEGDVAVR